MKRHLLAGAALSLTLPIMQAAPATAQSGEEEARQETIITVGSRRGERSAADSPAPVDVIGGAALVNQADNDLSNILRTSVPSYNVNTQSISDAATLVRPANLRGLSPDNTLVLVNGKRMHRAAVIAFLGGGLSDGSQGPDISTIPAIALKQIEVLRDGASSQYGSDAIAGVVNFVLKDDADGGQFEVKIGETYEGDGDLYQIAANVGLAINNDGFLNLSAEYQETDATSRSIQRTDAASLIAAGNTDVLNPAQIWGQPNVNGDTKLYANFGLPINENMEVYAFANYAERQTEGGFFFRNPTNRGGVYEGPEVDPDTGLLDPDDIDMDNVASVLVGDLSINDAGDCIAGIPLTDGGLIPDPTFLAQIQNDDNCFSFAELEPGGFTPRFGGKMEDQSFALGLRGDLGFGSGLGYDVSYRYGENQVDFFIRNTINASLGPETPRSFLPGGYGQIETVINADFDYGIAVDGFASDLNVAFGYEYREEQFDIRQGDGASFAIGPLATPTAAFPLGQGFSSSSNGFGGFTPNSAGKSDQNANSVYLDLEADVTEALVLQGAVRFEDYNTFGSDTNYKVGGLYRFTDNFLARATYSTGFHVPTAGQANVVNVTTAFSNGVLQDEGTFPLNSAAGQVVADYVAAPGGLTVDGADRPTLQPEESENFTLGVAFDVGSFNVTVDYFNIVLEDRISRSSAIAFLPALELLADNNGVTLTATDTSGAIAELDAAGVINAADFAGSEDLTSFAFFNNAFDTTTQGIDFVATGPLDFVPFGDTDLAVAFNWTETEVDRADDTISDGRIKVLEEGLPQIRGSATITNQMGAWRSLARVNYFGEGFEDHLDSNLDLPIDIDSAITFDAEIGFEVMEGLELIAGAQNLFDEYPNENPFGGVAGARYPVTSAFGFNGGSYYAKARYTW
ncbi:MAG: TonB-dependent receptor [Pseudomonadota bacterium]